MNYNVQLVYMDDKDVNIEIEESKLDAFYGSLSQKTVYWIEEKAHGFWTDLGKVRYVQVKGLTKQMTPEDIKAMATRIETPERLATMDGATVVDIDEDDLT